MREGEGIGVSMAVVGSGSGYRKIEAVGDVRKGRAWAGGFGVRAGKAVGVAVGR